MGYRNSGPGSLKITTMHACEKHGGGIDLPAIYDELGAAMEGEPPPLGAEFLRLFHRWTAIAPRQPRHPSQWAWEDRIAHGFPTWLLRGRVVAGLEWLLACDDPQVVGILRALEQVLNFPRRVGNPTSRQLVESQYRAIIEPLREWLGFDQPPYPELELFQRARLLR